MDSVYAFCLDCHEIALVFDLIPSLPLNLKSQVLLEIRLHWSEAACYELGNALIPNPKGCESASVVDCFQSGLVKPAEGE